MKDSCLKCKEISINILYDICMLKCDNINDNIGACDDRCWYHLVAFCQFCYDFVRQFLDTFILLNVDNGIP